MAPPSPIRHWIRSSPLGSGSFGHVSLAVNLDDGGLFAVKSIPCCSPASSPASPSSCASSSSSSSCCSSASSCSSAELLALENELHILAQLRSPRILRCLGSDYSIENGSGSRNLFLEYVDGGSIADLVANSGGRLDEHRVAIYTRGILEGLAYLHQNGIVHCDIKGQNILVGSSTGIKIADFGAAKAMGNSSSSSFRGTPLWMAPEVICGLGQGTAADIWSLGCTVVEMMQGRPPWSSKTNLTDLLFEIGCSEKKPPLPEFASEEAKDFLGKCLNRDPELRWTAGQLLEHPFVQIKAEEELSHHHQDSPRSTLDLFCHCDEEDDELLCSPPILSLPTTVPKPLCLQEPAKLSPVATQPREQDSSANNKGDWITVHCINGWHEDRHKPFFLRPQEEAGVMMKGSEVNFEAAAFLRGGGRRSVG